MADMQKVWDALVETKIKGFASWKQLAHEVGKRPIEEAFVDHLDRAEAAQEEMVNRWREARLRHPLTNMSLLAFAAGLLLGYILARGGDR